MVFYFEKGIRGYVALGSVVDTNAFSGYSQSPHFKKGSSDRTWSYTMQTYKISIYVNLRESSASYGLETY